MLMDIDNQNKIPFTFFKNLKKETCTAHESHESTCQIPTFQLFEPTPRQVFFIFLIYLIFILISFNFLFTKLFKRLLKRFRLE